MTGPSDGPSRLELLLDGIGHDVQSMDRLCRASADYLSMSGAGVSVVASSGDRGFVLATDWVSARIEELQFSLGEGPCIDAWSGRRAVMEPDLKAPGRWPVFAPAASAAGAAAVISLPLQVGETRLGAMDVYRDRPGGLSAAEMRDAQLLADAVTKLLLTRQPGRSEALPESATADLVFGIEVYQASGMVSVQLDVSITVAMARLQAYAYTVDQPLREVARAVVDRRLRMERD